MTLRLRRAWHALTRPEPRVFLLFAGENYYPKGGAGDFLAQADSIARAKVIAALSPIPDYYSPSGAWWEIAELRAGVLCRVLSGRDISPNKPDGFPRCKPPFIIAWSEPDEV